MELMETYTRKSDWFYDDREYYNYVLLNATQDVCAKVEQALKSNGVKVLKSAASFRPASNGIQYKWYIRVEGENFKSPSKEQIKSVIERVLISEIQTQSKQTPVVRPEKIDDSLNVEIKNLQIIIDQKNQELKSVSSELTLLEKQKKLLQEKFDNSEINLQQSRKTIEELRQQIIGLFKPDDIQRLQNQYDQRLHDKDVEMSQAKAELKQFLETFKPDIDEKNSEIIELKNQITMLEHEKSQFLETPTNRNISNQETQHTDDSKELFISMANTLLPDKEFLRDSLEFIWVELATPAMMDILSKVRDLNALKAKRVKCDERWKEYREGNSWRIYFRKCTNDKYQVLVSDKNSQESRDWNWLQSQPDC